jgi:hypothetical protein
MTMLRDTLSILALWAITLVATPLQPFTAYSRVFKRGS